MLRYTLAFTTALLLAPGLVAAQDSTHHYQQGGPIDTNRIGVMSPMVAQQRLRTLGYTNVTVMETARAAVHANAVKSGRGLVVRLDPHSGKVIEMPGRLERSPEGLRLIKPDGAVMAVPPQ